MFFDFSDKLKLKMEGYSDNRTITVYIKDGANKRSMIPIVTKIKKDLFKANYKTKIKYISDIVEKKEITNLLNEGIIFLDKKKKYLNTKIKTIGKLKSYEEKKLKRKKDNTDFFLYSLVFELKDKNIQFNAILFSNNKLNIEKEFNGYTLLEGIMEEDKYVNEKRSYKTIDLGYFYTTLKITKYKKIEYENQDSMDYQDEPRSVLHSHTLYSRNDAFISIEQIKEGFDKGLLESFAITDHREIRAFAEFQPQLKGTDYKVIPGLEAEVFDDLDDNFNYEEDIHKCDRYHMVLLLTSEDTEIEFKGQKIKVNEGYRAFNKLISDANLKYYSTPDKDFKAQQEADGEFKSSSKPIMSLKQILKYRKQGLLIIGSACIAGTVRKYWMLNDMEKFKKYFDIVDWVEIHPIHNEKFMIDSKFFKNINSIEDIKKKNIELVEYCKKYNKPFIFGDDAHVISKEERFKRSYFKIGEVSKFSSIVKPSVLEKLSEEEKEKNIELFYNENSIDKQPFLHTYLEVKKELTNQGFTETDIELFLKNEKEIADKCVKLQDITLIPKVMLIPNFPNVNVKTEVPRLAWEFAIKKWSKNGTKETINKVIKDRLQLELDALSKRNFEILYYFSKFLVSKSLEKGFMVGSRGSVGSSLLAYCIGISENNPLKPHYFCDKCKKIEFVETKQSGLDFENKACGCGGVLKGDGLNIEFSSFLGYKHDKTPDIDLNFSSDDLDGEESIQLQVMRDLQEVFPDKVNSIRSGTITTYSSDGLKERVLHKMPRIKEHISNEEFDIDGLANSLEGLYTTAGQHAGGILVWDNSFDVNYCFAFNWVGEMGKREVVTNSIDYHKIEEFLPKLDILGKKDPALLKVLIEQTNTKKEMDNLQYNDEKIYKALVDLSEILPDKERIEDLSYKSGALGVPELGTVFVRGVIENCKPKNFTDFVRIEGLTHGTMVYELAKPLIEEGMSLDEIPWCTRDEMFYYFYKVYDIEPEKAFKAIEFIRKGKWNKAPQELDDILKDKLPIWVYENVTKIKYLFPSAQSGHLKSNLLVKM